MTQLTFIYQAAGAPRPRTRPARRRLILGAGSGDGAGTGTARARVRGKGRVRAPAHRRPRRREIVHPVALARRGAGPRHALPRREIRRLQVPPPVPRLLDPALEGRLQAASTSRWAGTRRG